MDLARLKDPFPQKDVEWRVQQAGEKDGKPWAKVLAYVTNRAIMERLDSVVGPEKWKNEFKEGPGGGVLCGLSVLLGSEWVTKWDGAENTDIEAVKGGLSGAMKRAAVQWGIGRYLYDLDEGWAQVSQRGKFSAKTKDGKWFKWDPPPLPPWALPEREEPSTGGLGLNSPGMPQEPHPNDYGEHPPSEPPARTEGVKAGYKYALDDRPTYKSGKHVFSGGPHREKWNGWTWKEMAAQHLQCLNEGTTSADSSPIQNMLENTQYVKSWNREQAEQIDRVAKEKATPMEHVPEDEECPTCGLPVGEGCECIPF